MYILTKYSRLMNMKYIQVLLVLSLVPRYYIVHSYARLCTQKQMCSYMCYVPAKLPGDPRENHEYKFLNQRWQSLEKKNFLLPSRNKRNKLPFFSVISWRLEACQNFFRDFFALKNTKSKEFSWLWQSLKEIQHYKTNQLIGNYIISK